ncbi:PREDICTED: coiled-coil domain-containing protein CG32809 [Vollenhovia emeryi]|uniref:coiled-coil domain-containing protein CG32809 n=1 Tax=Vollenhovia emeryi TaxID=411798 RepID=UPI0005F46DC6|nr:PREDICTED: coiled-coil domain-containing protein CG32809 [Vollenhovia emeryi]
MLLLNESAQRQSTNHPPHDAEVRRASARKGARRFRVLQEETLARRRAGPTPGRPAGRRDVLGPSVDSTCLNEQAATPVPAERTVVGSASVLGGGGHPHESSADHQQRPENALDALLDELQTFSRPGSQMGHVSGGLSVHPGSNTLLADIGRASSLRESTSVAATTGGGGSGGGGRAPNISDIGRKGSVDSSSGTLTAPPTVGLMGLPGMAPGGTLRRLHSYPSSSDTDTSPPIARLQALSLDQQAQQQQSQPGVQSFLPGQKPPVPERNAELLQLASTRRVPPPPPPRTSSRSPLASPTSPQLPPRNHPCNLQSGNATLRRPSRGSINNSLVGKEGKPPMALPSNAILSTVDQVAGATLAPTAPGVAPPHNSQSSAVLSTSNSSSCESVNSQEGLQSKRGRQEQLEQRHQELLRKQKALQEQYARLQQLQRNAAGLTTVPPAPPDLLKKTGSESNLLAKMGLGLSAASSGSLTSLSLKPQILQEAMGDGGNQVAKVVEIINGQAIPTTVAATTNGQIPGTTSTTMVSGATTIGLATTVTTSTTTTSKVYETDIL